MLVQSTFIAPTSMSKRTRYADNSKRRQPVQQQRAQARQTGSGGPSRNAGVKQPPAQQSEAEPGTKR
jgi:hypothetical protein